jgi:hypothetical protein
MDKRAGLIGGIMLLVAILLIAPMGDGYAQVNQEVYGQNRLQLRKYKWTFFDTKHFRIYNYDKAGVELARYVSEQAEKDITTVEKKLGGQFPRRFNIILYNSYDEFRQTNVGRKNTGPTAENPAGTIDLVNDKLIVYYTGEHADVKRQLRAGMSKVVIQKMMFGESFREVVKNVVLLNLPQWVTEGYIAYIVDGWDTKSNTDWKNLLAARKKPDFHDLSEKYPEIAGKAFWKFVSEKYGENTTKNLLYAMQQKSNLNNGIKMTMGLKIRKAYDSCIHFYQAIYRKDSIVQELPDSSKHLIDIKKPKQEVTIRNIKVAPKGNDIAYTQWKNGEYKVYIQKTRNEKERSLILSGGQKDYNETQDPDYPLIAWSNTGYKMAIIYKKKNKTFLKIYNSVKAKVENYVIPNNRFDRVLGMTFMDDDEKMILSAIKNSQTDLYEFTIRKAVVKNITNDSWDDVQPWFVSGGFKKGVLFLSNRPQPNLNVPIAVNDLPVRPLNMFFYDTKSKRTELLQCTHMEKGTVSQPIQYGSDNFAFLYDGNGIRNKYVVMFGRDSRNYDSAYVLPVTNYPENIISHQYNPSSNMVADVVQDGKRFKVYFKKLEIPGKNINEKQLTPTALSLNIPKQEPDNANTAAVEDVMFSPKFPSQKSLKDEPILKGGNVFQSEFSDSDTATKKRLADDTVVVAEIKIPLQAKNDEKDSTYLKMKPEKYRLGFKPDYFSVRLDNSILFSQYQAVTGNSSAYVNPSLGGMVTISLYDALENHRFTGGFRLPVNFSGSSYFLEYENATKKLDWSLLFLRTTSLNTVDVAYTDTINTQTLKNTTNILQGAISYPFDRIRSMRLTTAFRQDAAIFKAQDKPSLFYQLPDNKQYWALGRLEYVSDNTITPVLNIHNGVKYKIWTEYMFELGKGGVNIFDIGADLRHYKKIYKNIIWAQRESFAHSMGSKRISYMVGGVDNWMNSQSSNAIRDMTGFAFQTLANNLRGYPQGFQAGDTYALINSEIRVPIVTTLAKRPIQSSLLRHLQLIAFMDIGSAWNGWLPGNSDANGSYPLYGSYPPRSPEVNALIDLPANTTLGMGYGVGMRTMLFSYFIRLDAAWTAEGSKKPVMCFSIGTDF